MRSMSLAGRRKTACSVAVAALLPSLLVALAPAAAQDGGDARLRKLESEVRALQRKVFPGGAGKVFEPELQSPAEAAPPPDATPASTPVTDLLARVDSIEAQLARLTAQLEESTNRTAKLEARVAAVETTTAAPPATAADAAPGPARRDSRGDAAVDPAADAAEQAGAPAIARSATGDAGEDAYLYGYRLYGAKQYPQAAQQLQAMVKKYPRHPRISYARNLLGRAYLEDGKPGTAAEVFLQNYQADRKGARAADSLLNLAVAMTRLKETGRACIALQEFKDTYPGEAAGRLASEYRAAAAGVKCP
jgi:TolA-binding protein